MDFAKRQLEKYGWSEGQGLGKHSTGIKTAIKPKIKLNTSGIGHDPAQEFTYHWWEDAFNDAANNINVQQTEDGIKVKTVVDEAFEISSVKRSKLKRDKMQYGAFLKRETLMKDGSVISPENKSDPVEESESRLPKLPATLSDDQLFIACGGLTAHKAARHGHKLSGKLQRVQEQEEIFLRSHKDQLLGSNNQLVIQESDECTRKKKHKKEKIKELVESVELKASKGSKRKEFCSSQETVDQELCEDNLPQEEYKKKKKKRKKDKC